MTGYLFGDRYQVGETLGFGGMSEVHRGRDLRLGRDVAIKVLRADLARDPSFQARFRREAQNAASLNHPAIVAVYDTGETTGENGPIPYIVMEYIDGETLREVLKREGPLDPRQAMKIVADICSALDFSHRHGIVHRDIKPANVMLNRAGAVKVMDFGIARAVTDGSSTMTATAAVIGTAQYLSPEQARGESVDARSDVYATGCVLYELLTGTPPFVGDTPVAIAYQHVRETPKPPSEVRPGLTPDLDAIVLKALNKNPLNRYQTAADMKADLVRALSGQQPEATPLMSTEEREAIERRGPERVGLGGPPLLAPSVHSGGDAWDDDEDPGRRARRVWGFVGIGVLCAALLVGAVWLTLRVTSAAPPTQQVAVPELTGMSADEATAKLRESGLRVGSISYVESTDEQRNQVINQRPSVRTQVDVDTEVALDIGEGVRNVSVPNVATYSPDAAKKALEAVNLLYEQKLEPSSDADKDKAIAQDPAPQASVPPGTTVTVTIGSGPAFTTVPDGLVNKTQDEATAILAQQKLTAVAQQVDGAAPAGTVVSVEPGPGTRVQENSSVTLTVSNGTLMSMPNLRNLTPDEAVARLRNAGWQGDGNDLKVQTQTVTNPAQVGVIFNQDPAAGASVSRTTTAVTVVIGVGAQVQMPSVVTLPEAQARAALSGFSNVTFVSAGPAPTPGQVGTVAEQSVPGGSTVSVTTRIQVSVYASVATPTPPPETSTTPPAAETTPPATPPDGGQPAPGPANP
ncbi:Stk1 family PASTA domain-containing Ser/Thr kinase [Nakamurella leprariae]|uniref:non-specific serine/threonine protein kinase n=1 Tax=Nakamurella leprariae TaxID=2803911 RepID=A0A939BZS6_9ACTN|nr:Stk1 family PASTA domain-containing Ser/Thr kinase [Nakamurella leprariae]MBM9468475.1 Stk1 family PASTA domain-containing Ser/Thr kinase [Nakamurella leprariae]